MRGRTCPCTQGLGNVSHPGGDRQRTLTTFPPAPRQPTPPSLNTPRTGKTGRTTTGTWEHNPAFLPYSMSQPTFVPSSPCLQGDHENDQRGCFSPLAHGFPTVPKEPPATPSYKQTPPPHPFLHLERAAAISRGSSGHKQLPRLFFCNQESSPLSKKPQNPNPRASSGLTR